MWPVSAGGGGGESGLSGGPAGGAALPHRATDPTAAQDVPATVLHWHRQDYTRSKPMLVLLSIKLMWKKSHTSTTNIPGSSVGYSVFLVLIYPCVYLIVAFLSLPVKFSPPVASSFTFSFSFPFLFFILIFLFLHYLPSSLSLVLVCLNPSCSFAYPQIRHHVYTAVAAQAIDYDGVLNRMSSVKWDISDLMSQHSQYVDLLLRQLQVPPQESVCT